MSSPHWIILNLHTHIYIYICILYIYIHILYRLLWYNSFWPILVTEFSPQMWIKMSYVGNTNWRWGFGLQCLSVLTNPLYDLEHLPIGYWLVVSAPLKNISQLGLLFPIYGKLKNVPNHQPVGIRWVNWTICQSEMRHLGIVTTTFTCQWRRDMRSL